MNTATRQSHILEVIREQGTISVSALTTELGASSATIRRDLADLDERGLLRRTHGGAKRLTLYGVGVPFAQRSDQGAPAKARMAAEVARRLRPGESVLIDAGTSCLAVAEAIHDQHLTAIPLSLHVANRLSQAPEIRLILPGGEVRPGEQDFVGPLTQLSLQQLNVDTAVVSGCAVSIDRGVTAHDVESAAIKATAVRSSGRAILLCDEEKWDTIAFAHVTPLNVFRLLITDHILTATEQEFFSVHDIDVVTV